MIVSVSDYCQELSRQLGMKLQVSRSLGEIYVYVRKENAEPAAQLALLAETLQASLERHPDGITLLVRRSEDVKRAKDRLISSRKAFLGKILDEEEGRVGRLSPTASTELFLGEFLGPKPAVGVSKNLSFPALPASSLHRRLLLAQSLDRVCDPLFPASAFYSNAGDATLRLREWDSLSQRYDQSTLSFPYGEIERLLNGMDSESLSRLYPDRPLESWLRRVSGEGVPGSAPTVAKLVLRWEGRLLRTTLFAYDALGRRVVESSREFSDSSERELQPGDKIAIEIPDIYRAFASYLSRSQDWIRSSNPERPFEEFVELVCSQYAKPLAGPVIFQYCDALPSLATLATTKGKLDLGILGNLLVKRFDYETVKTPQGSVIRPRDYWSSEGLHTKRSSLREFSRRFVAKDPTPWFDYARLCAGSKLGMGSFTQLWFGLSSQRSEAQAWPQMELDSAQFHFLGCIPPTDWSRLQRGEALSVASLNLAETLRDYLRLYPSLTLDGGRAITDLQRDAFLAFADVSADKIFVSVKESEDVLLHSSFSPVFARQWNELFHLRSSLVYPGPPRSSNVIVNGRPSSEGVSKAKPVSRSEFEARNADKRFPVGSRRLMEVRIGVPTRPHLVWRVATSLPNRPQEMRYADLPKAFRDETYEKYVAQFKVQP